MTATADREPIRLRYVEVDTANVSDILDGLGHPDQALDARFLPYAGTTLAGWAYTIAGEMAPGDEPTDPRKVSACEGVGPSEIAVWSGNGDGVCYFGELIALGMQQRGCVGAIVEGGVRDLGWLERAGFPVFATYRTPVQSIGRWRVTEWQRPVYLPGATGRRVTVSPGDFVLADEDGAIVIPQALAEAVLTEAERVTEREREVRTALSAGMTLQDTIDRYGPI
ncbi:MAG: RraA family protein [Nocardioidaceae bacterium]